MLLSARTMLKRVPLRLDPPARGRLSAPALSSNVQQESAAAVASPALVLAREQISARPGEYVSARQQANGE
jgi:hypothetical protein